MRKVARVWIVVLMDGTFQPVVIYPAKEIPTILHWAFEQVNLWAKPMVRDDYNPAPIKTLVDLFLINHFRCTQHESSSMDVDYYMVC